jgi:hypothetical protein
MCVAIIQLKEKCCVIIVADDMQMNSRFMNYPLSAKWTAFIPSVIGLVLFVALVSLYGRFPAHQVREQCMCGNLQHSIHFQAVYFEYSEYFVFCFVCFTFTSIKSISLQDKAGLLVFCCL